MRVYIAAPYTSPDPAINVKKAIEIANKLLNEGHVPFVPHLCHFWHLLYPHDPGVWLSYVIEWLRLCDAVIRLPGKSSGAEIELDTARTLHLPIYSPDQFFSEVPRVR